MKELNLNEVIYNQLRLINYDRSKSLLEQNNTTGDADNKRTFELLKSLGHTNFSIGKTMNHTYANAMYSSTVELVRLFQFYDRNLNNAGCRTLSKWDSGEGKIINSYDVKMHDEYEKLLPQHESKYAVTDVEVVDLSPVNTFTPANTFFLRDFYFNKNKFLEDINKTFKYDPNAYKSNLFPDGYWNWFTSWFEGDNFNTIKSNLVNDIQKNQLVVCDKGRLVARSEINTGSIFTDSIFTEEQRKWLHDNSLWITLVAVGLSLVVSGPLGVVFAGIATTIDILETVAYLEEGDYFMATLAFVFAILPFDKVMELAGRAGGKLYRIFQPILSKGNATKKDIEYAIELASKEGLYPTLQMIAKGGKIAVVAVKTFVKKGFKLLIEGMDLFAVTRFIMWSIKKGYLIAKSLFETGLVMGGVMLSWFTIARILGIKTPLDVEGNPNIISVNDEMLTSFEGLKEFGSQVSETVNNNNAFTVFLQYFLMAYGWNKSVDVTQKLTPDKLNSLYNYNPNKKSKSESDLNKKGYVSYDELLAQKSNLDIKPLKFRYGTFDFNTKKAVMTFQYAKGLKPDGVVGKNTLPEIINEMKTNKKKISNPYYGNDEKLKIEVQRAFDQFAKDAKEKYKWEVLKKYWEDYEDQRKRAAEEQEKNLKVESTNDVKTLMEIMEEMEREAESLDSQPTPDGDTDKGFPIGYEFNPETGTSIPVYKK